MKKLLIILFFLPLISFAQSRLPSFPTGYQWLIPEQSLSFPKVKRIVYSESSFREDLINTKLKYDIYYDNYKISTIKFIDTKTDSVNLIHSFDKFSRIINQLRFNGDFITKISYFYDEEKLKSTELQFDNNLTILKKTEIYYDNQYYPIKKNDFLGDSILQGYWTYKYNNFGDLIEESFINMPNGNGTILDSSITGGADKFFPSPNDTTRYLISYDNLKRPIIKTEFQNSKRRTMTEYSYEHDSSNIKIVHYFNNRNKQVPRQIEFLINHDSTRIQKTLNLDISDSSKVDSENFFRFINNEIREASQRSRYFTSHSIYRTDTQYDLHNNWIKKTTSEKGRITMILERDISY